MILKSADFIGNQGFVETYYTLCCVGSASSSPLSLDMRYRYIYPCQSEASLPSPLLTSLYFTSFHFRTSATLRLPENDLNL